MVVFSTYARVDALCEGDVKIGVDAITFDQVLNAWDECSAISLLLIQYGFICLSVISLPKDVYDQFISGWLSVLLSCKAICSVLPWASVLDDFFLWKHRVTIPSFSVVFYRCWMLGLRMSRNWTCHLKNCYVWSAGLKKKCNSLQRFILCLPLSMSKFSRTWLFVSLKVCGIYQCVLWSIQELI